jgi:N-formylglutamate amidohydrolase
MNTFSVHSPAGALSPVLLSIPHCGTAFPPEVADDYVPALLENPDDTDWFVDHLYDFASDAGITMIAATCSRWVIDLNRDPENKPLYSDGRIITGLCPVTNFLGDLLYKDGRREVAKSEVNRRLEKYYWPYHHKLAELLTTIKAGFGSVILWECHSIRQYVRTVYPDKIPDLILGDADGKSAAPALTEIALHSLKTSTYTINHNFPFKGGYITRKYGDPTDGTHALQLEMTKVNYMDDLELSYAPERALPLRSLLQKTLTALAATITTP